jgi:DHA1 family tetracycline resistance protein-like MFS transporter
VSTAPPAPTRKRALGTIFLTILLDLIGFGMILPLLPFYAQQFGASELAIGLLFSSYSLAQLVCAPLLGRLSDRVGRRPVLLVSIAGSAVAYLLFAAADSFLALLVARTLAGVAAANYAIGQAYVADVTPPDQRSKAMGLVGAAFGLGFVLGPAFGGELAALGKTAVPLAAAALAGINFVCALLWLRESLSAEVRGRSQETRWLDPAEVPRVLRRGPLGGLMILFFLVMLCFSMMEATLTLYCQSQLGFDEARTGRLFAYIGIVLVLVQGGLIGRLVRRFGERTLVLAGIALMAAGLLLLPVEPALGVLLAALTLLAVGSGLHNPSLLGLLSQLTDEGSQGGTIGVSRSFGALARTLGPPAGTWLFGAAGPRSPFWAAGGLMLIALVLGWGLVRRLPS